MGPSPDKKLGGPGRLSHQEFYFCAGDPSLSPYACVQALNLTLNHIPSLCLTSSREIPGEDEAGELGFGLMVELLSGLVPLALQKCPQEDKSPNRLMRVILCLAHPFRDCSENRNWGLQGVLWPPPLLSLGLSCSRVPQASTECPCLEEGRPVLSGC